MCEYARELQKPFPAEDIEWRVDRTVKTQNGFKAIVLPYVTNRAIMERLDQVFGVAGWKNEYEEWREKGVKCTILCKVEDEWVSKSDGADATNYEATKGGFSASMKRAAVQWGIGRYLYSLTQESVDIKSSGQNYINARVKADGKDVYAKGYWNTPKLPQWALPEGYEMKNPPPQESHIEEDSFEGLTPPPENEDLAAIEQASNERMGNPKQSAPPSNQQPSNRSANRPSNGGMKRVFDLRTSLNMEWKALNELASNILGREVKYPLKDYINKEEEWQLIEDALSMAKAS